MPTTGDLIDISSLLRTDTFETWYSKTNTIIDNLNPLQVYDVAVGASGGLLKQTGMSAGNYNGVVTLSVNPGPGIGTRTLGGQSRTIVDFALFDDYNLQLTGGASGSASSVASLDEYIINDVSDTSGGSEGTAKKVRAKNMLPPEIDIPSIRFSGDVYVGGNFYTLGNNAFISTNNLRIEDKQLEIAYQQSVGLVITGATGHTFLPASFGSTAYFFADNVSLTASIYARFQSYTGDAGPTSYFVMGSPFDNEHTASDVALPGYVSLSVTGNPRYEVLSVGTPYNSFLNDELLSDGGLVLKGASGDKQFLWLYNDTDSGLLYNAWISNTNLGVSGPNDGIISRNYRSYGYGKSSSEFNFQSENTTNADVLIGERNAAGNDIINSWKISKQGGSDSNLAFSFAATGTTSSSNLFTITRSPSGQTFNGVNTTSFASGFNSDLLDGAHGYTTSSPYSIPISNQYGTIDPTWLEASSIRKRFNITSHGLTLGNVVRITATGHIVPALATDAVQAETLGIVSSVSGNSFVVTLKGHITGLSGPRDTVNETEFTPGDVYFLAGTTAGKLLSTPDTGSYKLSVGQIRKAMFLAESTVSGYVMSYIGAEIPEGTDEVYLSGLVPVGTIIPYAGNLTNLTDEWLVCNGYRYSRTEYPDLHAAIGSSSYYAKASISSNTITLEGGVRNVQVGDVLDLYNYTTGLYVATRTVTVVSGSTLTVGGTPLPTGDYKVFLIRDANSIPVFFVPDLRTRVIVGGSTGSSYYQSNEYTTNYRLGDIGGSSSIQLTVDQLPPHSHGVSETTTIAGTNTGVVSSTLGTLNATTGITGAGKSIDNRMPYVTVNYVIRAKRKTNATILTGHNHDFRYIRYDGTHGSVDGLTFTGREQFRTNAYVSGIALGSVTSGDYHDHDGRYVRYDISSQNLTLPEKYYARLNTKASAEAEGDGLYSLGAGQTLHNHDQIYVRYDSTTQSAFNSAAASRFRDKIGVYGTAQADSRFLKKNGDSAVGNYNFSNGVFSIQDYFLCNAYAEINGNIEANGDAYFNNLFRVSARTPDIVGTPIGGGDAKVLQCYAFPNTSNFDSQCQTLVYGDFTVFGDGLDGGTNRLRPAHREYVFSVDPLSATIAMRGGFQAGDGSTVANPKLKFVDGNGATTPGVGIIVGLTAPTSDDGAANKWYVDNFVQLKYFNAVAINPARSDAPRRTSGNDGTVTFTIGGLENGTWLVDVLAYVYPGVRTQGNPAPTQRFAYNVSGDANTYQFNVTVDDNAVNAAARMVVTKHICTVTNNSITFTPKTPGNPNGTEGLGIGEADLMWIANLQLTGIKLGS